MAVFKLLLLALCIQFSLGCSCIQETRCDQLQTASTLFRGTLSQTFLQAQNGTVLGEYNGNSNDESLLFVVDVERVFLGSQIMAGQTINISSGASSMCGYKLEDGVDYLIDMSVGQTIGNCGATTRWESLSPVDMSMLENADVKCSGGERIVGCSLVFVLLLFLLA
jgi:hypothetical protein